METLPELVDRLCTAGAVPGVVALLATGEENEQVVTGGARTLGGEPMTRDTVFRIASMTKPIIAASTMVLVERGQLGLDDTVERWLPELAAPQVLRTPTGPLDDVVPAQRPITVRHLLAFQSGHGFIPDFDAPVSRLLLEQLHQGPPQPRAAPGPDEWMARLSRVPLVHQPGCGWTYNTGADILGVLLGRAESATLQEVLTDTVLGPLGMRETGFATADVGRLASSYRVGDAGELELVDSPEGQWSTPPAFQSGGGGLLSTVDDWAAFGRMLLHRGEHAGRAVLAPASVAMMTSPQAHAEPGNLFLDGQAWGFGGAVDVNTDQPWNVPGRYGWIGGTGTAGYVIPSTGVLAVWLTQRELQGPADFAALADFLTLAATG